MPECDCAGGYKSPAIPQRSVDRSLGFPGAPRLSQQGVHPAQVVVLAVHGVLEATPQHLFGPAAEKVLGARIPEQNLAVQIGGENGVAAGAVQQVVEERLALSSLAFGSGQAGPGVRNILEEA